MGGEGVTKLLLAANGELDVDGDAAVAIEDGGLATVNVASGSDGESAELFEQAAKTQRSTATKAAGAARDVEWAPRAGLQPVVADRLAGVLAAVPEALRLMLGPSPPLDLGDLEPMHELVE